MELSVVHSRAEAGLLAPPVQVEVHLSNGLPAFTVVGMPETAVRESKDRVRSALLNSHFTFPDRRITVNLAPADLPKSGGRFDLAIALGILAASGQLPAATLCASEFFGELALDGSLRRVRGLIPAVMAASEAGRRVGLPTPNAAEAAGIPGARLLPAPDLLTLCASLRGRCEPPVLPPTSPPTCAPPADLADVIGQPAACRALEIAASGGHNLLLTGPPGTGKTLLASRLPGILPPLSSAEALTSLALHDLAGLSPAGGQSRPFRAPHHSASAVALVGGGSQPRPGEISLAHGGVLFLDELPEFPRHCLEMLREPLESGEITLSRARHKTRFPARFQLIAAMNPCPCGFAGDPTRHCRCTPDQLQRYRQRISGPLMDRIDLQVTVSRPAAADLLETTTGGTPSAPVRTRVSRTMAVQEERQSCLNGQLPSAQIVSACLLNESEKQWLGRSIERLGASGRALHRCLRVARTIADMAGSERVTRPHLAEALGYREPAAGSEAGASRP